MVRMGGKIGTDVLRDSLSLDGPPEQVDLEISLLVLHVPDHQRAIGVGHIEGGSEGQAGKLHGTGGRGEAEGVENGEAAAKGVAQPAGKGPVFADGGERISQICREIRPGGKIIGPEGLNADDIRAHSIEHGLDGGVFRAVGGAESFLDVKRGHPDIAAIGAWSHPRHDCSYDQKRRFGSEPTAFQEQMDGGCFHR